MVQFDISEVQLNKLSKMSMTLVRKQREMSPKAERCGSSADRGVGGAKGLLSVRGFPQLERGVQPA